jgi:toxin ParE1/3/4
LRTFKRTDQAELDLIEIWLHIARDKPSAAENVLGRVDGACERLAQNPQMGPARPDLAADLRYFVVGAYLILYREGDDSIEIVRVVHGAMNLNGLRK